MLVLAFTWLANVITRIKTGTIFRYSELYYVTRPFASMGRLIRDNMSLMTKVLLVMGLISVVEVLFIIELSWASAISMLFYIPYKLLQVLVLIYVLAQMKQLQEGSKRIASGDLSQPIDTSRMLWELKKHGDNINKMGEGISIAVEEQLKSERFKTELITNVSHDIKTPLTSIINYVDLIKKEDVSDPKMEEYVEVLDRQSARLKKLIEDLMEASKASTGNLEVHPEECDMQVMLTQVIGEFGDKLAANQLEVILEQPEEPVHILADGRHLWRVLDNLMNNVCKYSQANTRVYVSLKEAGGMAEVVFKNISKSALNIPSDQLMQRFVRGDSSRHTEGSGLGLSIAQSLTELMGGTMKLEIDGDLFKVTLKFNSIA
jgi:signal transduction histidine kinase